MRIEFRQIFVPFLFLSFIAAHIYLAAGAVYTLSPTYDEPVHLTAGVVYWKTKDYRLNGLHHPPFAEMWPAIPVLFMNPIIPKHHPAWLRQEWTASDQYSFADTFIFRNRIDAESMMGAARWMQIGLSVLLGLVVAWTSWQFGGAAAAIFSLGFWAFSPAILANGTVVSTDLAFSFFFFSFFAALLKYEKPWGGVLSGISLGFCFASKFFAAAAVPIAVFLMTLSPDFRRKIRFKSILVMVVSVLLSIAVVYQFTGFDVFWDGFTRFFGRSQAGRSSFFMGEHRTQGWLAYFPTLFLLKTPIPLLLSLALAGFLIVRKKITIPALIWGPPLFFMLAACLSKVQIGHRYILALYPFLFVLAGSACAYLNTCRPSVRLARVLRIAQVIFFIGWTAFGTWRVRPNFLAYFNEVIGGPSQAYRYFTDSNIDWGQSLKALSKELEPQDLRNGIYLSYFGVVHPHVYGIRYKDVGSDRIVGHLDDSADSDLKPSKFAISVTNLQSTYYSDKTVFGWLADYQPWKIVGHSIFIYDFKDNPSALARLEALRA